MPANCPPHGWPIRKHEDLVNLLPFAEVMNSGRTQFRPTPSCQYCHGTGKNNRYDEDDQKCAACEYCDGTGKVEGEEHWIRCKVKGWGSKIYPWTNLRFTNGFCSKFKEFPNHTTEEECNHWTKKGKVFCRADIKEAVGNNSCSKHTIKMTNVGVLKIEHVGDLSCPGCQGTGHKQKVKDEHLDHAIYDVPCVRCGGNAETNTWGSGNDRAHYKIILDKWFGFWTLNIEIPLMKNHYFGATRWEKVLNSIRNVDPTIVKFRPQSSPGNRGRRD